MWVDEGMHPVLLCDCCDAPIKIGDCYYKIKEGKRTELMCEACFGFWADERKEYMDEDDRFED